MCIIPTYVDVLRGPKWEKQAVPCRKCWRCRKSRVDDYVGRCLAEASTSEAICTVSLTYAPRTDLADKILHPRHFQLFMKLLRKAGHKVRYLVVGEYGDQKGRAHFHAILFFEHLAPRPASSPVPFYNRDHQDDHTTSGNFSGEIPQQRMCHIREWPHGHIKADWTFDERAIRYVCKYLLADDKNRAWFSLSKKPALGAAWFAHKAAQARSMGVLPSSFQYVPPGGSESRRYVITGATRRDYMNAITQDPSDKPRMSEWALKTFEKHERSRLLADLDSQPPEVLEAAFIAQRERSEEQARLMRVSEKMREASNLDDLLAISDHGVLRLDGDKWLSLIHI